MPSPLAVTLPPPHVPPPKRPIPIKAIRGRASFLGDRSIGHMDPGARSSALMIAAVCEVLERV